MRQKQVVVGKFDNAMDAEIAKGHLDAAGIEAAILKDDGGGMFPSLQQTEGVQLVVAKTQEKKAKAILQKKSILI